MTYLVVASAIYVGMHLRHSYHVRIVLSLKSARGHVFADATATAATAATAAAAAAAAAALVDRSRLLVELV
jgi:hypothetical protein